MKINLKVLQKLAPTYGVNPSSAVAGLAETLALCEKAPAKYEPIVTGAGYEWSDETNCYLLDDQRMYFFAPKKIFIWVWGGAFMRVLQGSDLITKWVQGNDKYPEGKANSFMGIYKQMTGQSDDGGGTAVAEPDEPDEDDAPIDRSTGGSDIEVTGNATRGGDYEPKDMDPADALIVRTKKKMGSKGTLPADDIIDLYQQAKKMGSNKLMNFIKTIKPLNENFIKKSTLDQIIRHIVRNVVNEAVDSSWSPTPKPNSEDNVVLSIADKTWGSPAGKQWRLVKSKGSENGTVYQLQVTHPISRFVWKTKDGGWKVLDPKTKQWSDVAADVQEMSVCAAAGPVTGPNAFKKKKIEEEPISEMTTTGAVQGYNVPGAFARKGGSDKGVKGSEALGYTLTKTGKKDMQRSADKLFEGSGLGKNFDKAQRAYDNQEPPEDHDCEEDGHRMKRVRSKGDMTLYKCGVCGHEEVD